MTAAVWGESLVHIGCTARLPELALALAAGYAAARLADELARVGTHVLAQKFGDNPVEEDGTILGLLNLFTTAPYSLNFMLGDTLVVYGEVVSATVALAVVALAAVIVIRARDSQLSVCSYCAGRIRHGATRCAICGSSLEPVET